VNGSSPHINDFKIKIEGSPMTRFCDKSIFSSKPKPAYFSRKSILSGVLLALSGSLAVAQDADRNLTATEQGTHNGFYYNFWVPQTAGAGDLIFGLREAGRYTAEWNNNIFRWSGGIGWNPGSPYKVLQYSGKFSPGFSPDQQNSFLALYGWATKPATEYHIVETYGTYNPSSCITPNYRKVHGSFQSDGATYDIVSCKFISSNLAADSYDQVFSVRNPRKPWGDISGTITVANHFDAWESRGLLFDDINYMILMTDGYQSSGSSDITVKDITPPLNCGDENGMPICCNISADPDGDGIGTQGDGEMCTVTEATRGWYASNPPDVLTAINVGGKKYHREADGIYYAPLSDVKGAGYGFIWDTDVIGGGGSTVYQSYLYGTFTIEIPVSEQRVSVELGFVEPQFEEAGRRTFNVTIEDKSVFIGLDLYAEAGYQTLWKPAPLEVEVTDGSLTIAIIANPDSGVLNSILVRKIDDTPSSSSSSSSSSSASSSSSTSSSSASSSSGNGSGNSGTSGGSSGWWLLAITGLLVARRRMLSQDASA
jgi:uncharacterized membrane protein YgcG